MSVPKYIGLRSNIESYRLAVVSLFRPATIEKKKFLMNPRYAFTLAVMLSCSVVWV
jgi:hypothetical protein